MFWVCACVASGNQALKNCGILTWLERTWETGEQTLTSLRVVISTCGSTANLSMSTSPLQELGDQIELAGISKLEY